MNNYNINIIDKDDSFIILLISSENDLSGISLDELNQNGFNSAHLSLSDANIAYIQGINPSIIILDVPNDFDVTSFINNTFSSIQQFSILIIYNELEESIVKKYKQFSNICMMQKPLPTEMLIKHLNFSRSMLYSYKLRVEENQSRFKELIMNLNDIFFEINLEGIFLFVSPASERITGYTPEELIGKHYSFLLHHSSIQDFNACFSLIDAKEYFSANKASEVLIVKKDGRFMTMLSSVGKMIFKAGSPYCFSGILTDITKQKETQKQLIEARDSYEAIVKSIPDLIFRHNIDGVIVDYQFSSTNELIVPPEKVIGTKLEDLPFNQEDIVNIRASIKKAIKTGEVVSCKYSWQIDGIDKHYEARFSVISEDEVFAIVRDITEQVELIANLKERENSYRLLVENTNAMIIRTDAKLKPLFINNYAKEFFEISDNISCNNLAKFLFPGLIDSSEICENIFSTFLENKNLLENIEVKLRKKNRDVVWVSWVHTPIYDDNNNIIELLSIGTDRTRLKVAEQNILDTANQILKFQEALSNIFVLDTKSIDDSIKRIIKLTAETLKVERIGYWELCGDEPFIKCRFLYERTADKFSSDYQIKKESIKDYLETLFKKRKIVINDIINFEHLSGLKEYFTKIGITSIIDTLIRISDKNIGIICVEHVGVKREWSLQETDFVLSISDRISFELEANERKLALESKSIIERRFKTFVEKTNDILMSVDYKGIINFISPNVKNKLDFDVEYFLGQPIIELIHDEDYPEFYSFLKKLFSGEDVTSSYVKFRSKNRNGDWLWFQAAATLINSDSNNSDYAILYTTDITTLVEAEISVRESKGILQSIFDTVNVGIMLINADGNIEHINKSGTNIFGYYTNEMIGKHFSEYLPDYARTLGNSVFNTIMKECQIQRGESIILTKSGANKYISIEFDFLFRDNNTPWLVCVFSDITEKRIMDEQIRRSKEQAEIANRLKSEFLANVSHEIRTPLNSIIGFAHLVAEMGVNDKQANYITSIKNSGKNLLAMINDIIDLSKIESGKLVPMPSTFNVYELFEKTFEKFKQKAIDNGLNLIMHIDGNIPIHIVSDEERLKKILDNLIDNAIKYTDKGYVKFSLISEFINFEKSIIDLKLIVEDTGQGISDDLMQSIYEPFAKQDRNIIKHSEGFGTGLSLVKKLSDMLNYDISVDSKVDSGTTFNLKMNHISFELLMEGNFNIQRENITKSAYPIALINISSFAIFEKTKELIKRYNFDYYTCSNLQDMLEVALKVMPDIVIVDSAFEMNIMKFILDIKAKINGINLPIMLIGSKPSKELIFNGFTIENLDNENEFHNELKRFVPNIFEQRRTCKEVDKKEFSLEIEKLDNDTIAELSAIFNKELIPTWSKVSRSSILNEIEQFGNANKNYGEQFNVFMLSQYGNKLIKQTKDFDFDMLPSTLSDFKIFIDVIDELVINK